MQTLIKGRSRIQSRIRCKIPNSEPQQSLSYCQTCLLYKIPPHLHALKSHCFKFLQFFRQIEVVRLVTSANRRKLSGYFFGIWAHSFLGSFKFYRIFSVFWLRTGYFLYMIIKLCSNEKFPQIDRKLLVHKKYELEKKQK